MFIDIASFCFVLSFLLTLEFFGVAAFKYFCEDDDIFSDLIARLLLGQPWLHRVCQKLTFEQLFFCITTRKGSYIFSSIKFGALLYNS